MARGTRAHVIGSPPNGHLRSLLARHRTPAGNRLFKMPPDFQQGEKVTVAGGRVASDDHDPSNYVAL